jgi:hypothetical protein
MACDPIPHANLFQYAASNPVILRDLNGREPSTGEQSGTTVPLSDLFRIHAQMISKHGLSDYLMSQDVAKEVKALTEDAGQAAYEKDLQEAEAAQEKGPSVVDRAKGWVASKAAAVSERVSESWLGRKAAAVDDSLKETAELTGARGLEGMFGGVQGAVQRQTGGRPEFKTTPYKMGSELGRAAYGTGKEIAVQVAIGATIRVGGNLLRLAEEAGVAEYIEGRAFVGLHGTTEEIAAQMVETQGGFSARREGISAAASS